MSTLAAIVRTFDVAVFEHAAAVNIDITTTLAAIAKNAREGQTAATAAVGGMWRAIATAVVP